MARKLKPHKIDEYTDHESGRVIDIMFDRNDHDFFADINGVEVRDETKKGCVQKVRVESSRQNNFEWRNIIRVRCAGGHRWFDDANGSVSLSFSRHRIAPREDGAWNEHHCYFHYLSKGLENGIYPSSKGSPTLKRFRGDTESNPEKGVYVLPYSDEIWEGLQEIERRINILREQLQRLLASDEVEAILSDLQDTQALLDYERDGVRTKGN